MSFKRILLIVSVLTVLLALTACGKCKDGHVDADGDLYCDECEEKLPCTKHKDENGDLLCDICEEFYEAPIVKADYSVSVSDEDGAAMSGVKVIIVDEDAEEVASGTTDANGGFAGSLPEGTYIISFEVNSDGYVYVPGGYIDISSEDENKFTYTAIDNTPDGSAQKPFFLGEDVSTYNIPAGKTYTFTIKGEERKLVIENVSVKVVYDGVEYGTAGERIEIAVSGPKDANDPPTAFTVTNTAAEDAEVTLTFVSTPGSRNNPIEITLGESMTSEGVTLEKIVYYTFTAESAGDIVITSTTATNRIKMTNLSTYRVTDYTSGAESASVTLEGVSAGNEILVEVSTSSSESINIEFILTFVEK